jgi:hypothetical protein
MVMMGPRRNERYHSDVATFFEGSLDFVKRAETKLYTMQHAFAALAQALSGVMRPRAGKDSP